MAQGYIRIEKEEVMEPVCATDSEVFAKGSPVTINSSGFLAVASSSGEKIYGFCTEAVTVISTNSTSSTAGVTQTSDSTAVGYAPRVISPRGVKFWADSDTTFTQTDIGAYLDIASESSGVVTLNLSATTSGQFVVVGLASNVDPGSTGDTDRIVVEVAEPQISAAAQA